MIRRVTSCRGESTLHWRSTRPIEIAMQPVLLQHNCGRTAFPFESCRSPRLADSNWVLSGQRQQNFSPGTNVSSSPLLSFRSSSIFKAAQERGERRREGWKGMDGAALVSLSGPLQKCAWRGNMKKRECCLTLNELQQYEATSDFVNASHTSFLPFLQ